MNGSFNPVFTITNRITFGLTQIERARGFLEAATLSESWVRAMGRRALILEAHHTTHIEGAISPWIRLSGYWKENPSLTPTLTMSRNS